MARKGGAGGVIVVAVALGLVTAYLIWAYFRKISESNRENWQVVLVARQDIPAKTKISAEMLKQADFPKERLAEDVLLKSEQVVGKMARRELRSGDQIRAGDLTTEGAMPGLSYKIPEGMRAIAIGAGEVMAVGASVQPGERVDILASYKDPVTNEETTKMLMQNVLVLAVNRGQTEAGTNKDGTATGASSSMTLAVKPEDTEVVMAMERAGALRVSLRPRNDDTIHTTTGIVVRDLRTPPMVVTNTPPATAPDRTPVVVVRPPAQRESSVLKILRGTAESTVAE